MADSLSEQTEYAILNILAESTEKRQQNFWGEWEQSIRATVPRVQQGDLKDAFKLLWRQHFVRLTKPDTLRRDASEYSGRDKDDNSFFFIAAFNAILTPEGRAHWNRIKRGSGIGFTAG